MLGYFAILHEFVNPRSYHIADCRCALFCTSWQASVNNLRPCSTEDCGCPVVWRLRGGGYVLPLHVLADVGKGKVSPCSRPHGPRGGVEV